MHEQLIWVTIYRSSTARHKVMSLLFLCPKQSCCKSTVPAKALHVSLSLCWFLSLLSSSLSRSLRNDFQYYSPSLAGSGLMWLSWMERGQRGCQAQDVQGSVQQGLLSTVAPAEVSSCYSAEPISRDRHCWRSEPCCIPVVPPSITKEQTEHWSLCPFSSSSR